MKRLSVVVFLAMAAVLPQNSSGKSEAKVVKEKGVVKMEWEKTDSSLALIVEGKQLWRFQYADSLSKPYFS